MTLKENTEIKRKLNLKNDIVFKAFFSRKGNEKYLIDFLNALLEIEIKEIKIREEVNLEKLREEEKGGRLDIQAILNDGILVNIEMQVKNRKDIEKRNEIYEAKTISRYFSKGEEYRDAKQVIMVNILDYKLFGFEEYVSNTITVLEKHREYKVESITKEYYIELPKFRERKVDMDNKLNQWLAFIDDEERGKIKMAEEKNEVIREGIKEMEYLTGEEEIKRLEELREKWESDWNSEIGWAREEGREKGKEEGKKSKQIEIAKKLKKMGIKIDKIVEATELTEEEIKNIK